MVNDAYEKFSQTLSNSYNNECPMRTKQVKKFDISKPYINLNIKTMIKEKHKLQKLYNKRPATYGKQYRSLRNKLNSTIRSAKSEYFKNKFSHTSLHKRWDVVNGLLGGRKTFKKQNGEFYVADELTSDAEAVSNGFNEYFSKVGERLSRSFTHNSNYLKYLQEQHHSMEFRPTDVSEITGIVNNLRDCAPGSDGLPAKLYRDNVSGLSEVIVYICNLSLKTGTFPRSLMLAKVTCIYKTGDERLFSNYRPISVLNIFSKIVEKVVTNRIVEYFTVHDLFSPRQFGFREGKSTEGATQDMVCSLYEAMDTGQVAVGVYLDISKAFDSLDRKRALG